MENDIAKYYETLGLGPEASEEQVREAYRDLVKVWHPDRFHHDPKLQVKAQEKLKKINEAYQQIQEDLNAFKSASEQSSQSKDNFQSDTGSSQENGAEESQPPPEPPKEPPPFSESINSIPRPWVRYWARTLDMILLSIPSGFLLGLLFPSFINDNPLAALFFLLPATFVVEACLLSVFGNTPIKALLKIKITNAQGDPLLFSEAIKRCAYIYIIAFTAGIPLIPFFTHIWQYKKLIKEGKTSWDRRFNLNVTHEHINGFGLRTAAYVVIYIVCLLFISTLNVFQKEFSQNKKGTAANLDFDPYKKSSTIKLDVPDPFKQNTPQLTPVPYEGPWSDYAEGGRYTLENPNLNAQVELGNALMDAGRFPEAVDAYQKALEIDPKNTDVRVDMGTCYRSAGQPERAAEEYRKAISSNPGHPNAHRNLGIVLAFDLKNKREAIKEFEEYLRVAPNAPDAQKIAQLIAELNKIKITPSDAEAFRNVEMKKRLTKKSNTVSSPPEMKQWTDEKGNVHFSGTIGD